ncbi:MAG: FAD-dependent 5-carboxymethylaminomethyl-2-thiouridine(34) oxidoreductase MnmC [Maricaulaceae bacterium]|jgi:tRNA 5-methylaminomethyl-2-thiouridine biosynthesis bifunctional protein
MASSVPNLAPGVPELAPAETAGPPRSTAFDDPYFSSEDGLSESEAVFLAGCSLPEAWAGTRQFVVGELGFGTGLNFLALWRLWRREGPKDGWLHFVSVEGFPLTRDQARGALASFEALGPLRNALLAAWPPRIKGVHRRVFAADRVTLTLAHLPVREALAQLDFAADAWFLDGFAPARNPDMWSPEVFAAIARASRPGARAATFTVAGDVRRRLEAVGFAVEKKPGHGRKRERLEARLARSPAPAHARAAIADGPTLIIGAGIAGAGLAAALARRGRETILLDAGAGPGAGAEPGSAPLFESAALCAAGASGVPAGLVAPRLDLDDRPEARLHRCAYAFALDAYAGADAFRPIGVRRAALEPDGADRLARLLASDALPPDMACASEGGGLLLDQAGVLDPAAWIVETLGERKVQCGASVAALEFTGGAWVACDDAGRPIAEAPSCVIAAGASLARWPQTAFVPITASRGQLTVAPLEGPPPEHAASWGGYYAPLTDGRLAFGATFDDAAPDASVVTDAASDARNLETLKAFAPDLAARVVMDRAGAFTALRATTPDRLPVLGPAIDAAAFEDAFGAVGPSAAARPELRLPGLYLFGGLGSRGFTLAPLLAEALAAHLCGEPGAIERGAANSLDPARFLLRRLKRER